MSGSRGTETRQRTKLMGVRLLPEEHDRIREAAAQQGVSMSELVISPCAQQCSRPNRRRSHSGSFLSPASDSQGGWWHACRPTGSLIELCMHPHHYVGE